MVGPGVYTGKKKLKETSHCFGATPNNSVREETAVPLTDQPLPTNLTLKFDTNIKLQRNSLMATVTILNAFVTVALIAAAVPTGAYIQNELNSAQDKIVALQDQVKFLTERYEYVLSHLRSVRIRSKRSSLNENLNQISNNVNFLVSAQHTHPSQHKDVNTEESSQDLETKKQSLVPNNNTKQQQSSADTLTPEETFSPSFSEEPHTSDVAVQSDSSQYGSVTLRRTKRSEWRGKQSQRKQSKNGGRGRQRRRGKFSGVAVAHFKGGQPETFIRDGGLVAPWFLDDAASGRFGLSAFQLKQGKAAVEVTESGLYYIYSQIHYLTSQITNSYSLNLKHGSQSNSSVLSYCSVSSGSQTLNEVSCFTSVVRYLNSTDRVFIQQRDMNRRIILRDGYSYLGVVRLST